jgi:hypothetical protein
MRLEIFILITSEGRRSLGGGGQLSLMPPVSLFWAECWSTCRCRNPSPGASAQAEHSSNDGFDPILAPRSPALNYTEPGGDYCVLRELHDWLRARAPLYYVILALALHHRQPTRFCPGRHAELIRASHSLRGRGGRGSTKLCPTQSDT